MKTIVDARGLSCPQPVILARKAIQKGEFPIQVLVDTVTSRDNVRRMAEKEGCKVSFQEIEECIKLDLTR